MHPGLYHLPVLFDERRYRSALQTVWLGHTLDYRDVVGSTMDVARSLAAGGAADGTVVLAEEQTAGRGRRGRTFYSPRGDNLYFTIILKAPAVRLRSLPIVVPLAVAESIGEIADEAAVKWPNDIWLGERKCCGMLIDVHREGDLTWALAGIGINVNGDPARQPDLAGVATSIARFTGRPVGREALLAGILSRLEPLLGAEPGDVAERYAARSNTLGREVSVQPAAGEPFEGRAMRINETGALVVQLRDGTETAVEAADVSVRPRS